MNEINIHNLNFSYEDEYVLQNINLTIQKNDFITVIGPNGGGKTTLFKLLLGLEEPTTGEITIFGKKPKKQLNKIGYVPQHLSIDTDFPISVEEFILIGAAYKANWLGKYPDEVIKKADELIQLLYLEDKRTLSIKELSGGQMQRVLLAKALVSDPEILLLDEPTSCTDKEAESIILDLLFSLKNKKTILLISHDLELLMKKIDFVISIHVGAEKLPKEKICEHFTYGLYHKPFCKKEEKL